MPDSVFQKPSPSSSPPPPGSSSRDQGRPAPGSQISSHGTSSRLGSSPEVKGGARLAERRGAVLKPLPESPGPEIPDKEGLFAQGPQNLRTVKTDPIAPKSVNRFSSIGSTSTTRASRGSPVPPETPILGPGDLSSGGSEACYASTGIAETATLRSLQAQNAAANLRSNQYAPPPLPQIPTSPPRQQAPRPWTPTESPEDQPHGPPTVYQGPNQISRSGSLPPPSPHVRQSSVSSRGSQPRALEQDLHRMQLSASPPPAYSNITPETGSSNGARSTTQGSHEKQTAAAKSDFNAPFLSYALQHPGHPAFANDPRQPTTTSPLGQRDLIQHSADTSITQGEDPTSPPPLPEGWIAHLDQASGQYYYIHLPTQATQWEFPKGPTPLNLEMPLSPSLSTYSNPSSSPVYSLFSRQSLASSMRSPSYAESIMSITSQALTAGSFSGPPPTAVDMYMVSPTNGVYFGPYLRYTNMDLDRGLWLGSIMLVTDTPQPPTIHIHQSVDLSPNPRQLEAKPISTHRRWVFYRYDIDLQMSEGAGEKWTYAVTSHLGCTRYEFLVAGRYETNWRFIAHSGSDFGMNTNLAERERLGGIGFMWKDVLQKNVGCGGFHVQLGLGDQIYADRLWREVPLLKQWLAVSGKDNRRQVPWTARHEEDVTHAYFHYYTSHFDQSYLREAFAQIPHVLQINDHEIFDGCGSYPEYMQSSQMFKNIKRIGIETYLLFQHHTTIEMLRKANNDRDLFTITSTGWHFVKYLGPAVVIVGLDGRSERTQQHVMAGPTYQGLFPKVATLPPSVQHCIWMISVPIIYPRLEAVESFANTVASGKKAVNTTYNLVGKVTSSVAGVVGGKEAVASGFSQVKKAVGKSGLMGGVLNSFGDIDIADELRDLWTHKSKDLERTYLIRTLQGIANHKGIRMTFLSGGELYTCFFLASVVLRDSMDVHCCGAGLLHDLTHPNDHKTMYQIISSSIVASPIPNYIIKMLHNDKSLYIPQNGHRSTHQVSDTKEDMMEIFHAEANGAPRELKKLMGRRNYVAFAVYDPREIPGMDTSSTYAGSYSGSMRSGPKGLSKLSLAVDFIVQEEGAFSAPTKYGPVIVPSLEFGR